MQSKSDKNEMNKDNTASTTDLEVANRSDKKIEAQEKAGSKATEAGNATEFSGEQFPKILEKTKSLYPVHRNVAKFLDVKEVHAVAATRRKDSMFVLEEEQRRVRLILNKFLESVARGEQDKAEKLLKISQKPAGNPPSFWLLGESTLTDYSGRTFNCTAYEYAYWAKDIHMCRMLEGYMDDETKAKMLVKINAIESKGLPFRQNDNDYRSTHFSLKRLKDALQTYVDCEFKLNWDERDAAWLEVGKEQRDVPAHVANEYCRSDRSFDHTAQFRETTLPRETGFSKFCASSVNSWFPISNTNSGLGFDFAILRAQWGFAKAIGRRDAVTAPWLDLEAIARLDEVRTADLTQSRENLTPPALSLLASTQAHH